MQFVWDVNGLESLSPLLFLGTT